MRDEVSRAARVLLALDPRLRRRRRDALPIHFDRRLPAATDGTRRGRIRAGEPPTLQQALEALYGLERRQGQARARRHARAARARSATRSALPLGARRRHQRQGLDVRADRARAARGRPSHRALHLAPPGRLPRAHPRRRPLGRRGVARAAARATSSALPEGEGPHVLRGRRPRSASLDFAAADVGVGGGRSRPRRAGSTAPTCSRPRSRVITRSGSTTPRSWATRSSEIAGEKAGIVKPGVPRGGAREPAAARGRSRGRARARRALVHAAERVERPASSASADGLRSRRDVEPWRARAWRSRSRRHQLDNAVAALATLGVLASAASRSRPKRCAQDSRAARWPGRLEPCPTRAAAVVGRRAQPGGVRGAWSATWTRRPRARAARARSCSPRRATRTSPRCWSAARDSRRTRCWSSTRTRNRARARARALAATAASRAGVRRPRSARRARPPCADALAVDRTTGASCSRARCSRSARRWRRSAARRESSCERGSRARSPRSPSPSRAAPRRARAAPRRPRIRRSTSRPTT